MRLGIPESADLTRLQNRQKSFVQIGEGATVLPFIPAMRPSRVSRAGTTTSRRSSRAKSISGSVGVCHSTTASLASYRLPHFSWWCFFQSAVEIISNWIPNRGGGTLGLTFAVPGIGVDGSVVLRPGIGEGREEECKDSACARVASLTLAVLDHELDEGGEDDLVREQLRGYVASVIVR